MELIIDLLFFVLFYLEICTLCKIVLYLDFYDGAFVSIYAAVIGCREYCYNCWKITIGFASPAISLVALRKYLMSSYYTLHRVGVNELFSKLPAKIYWALPWFIEFGLLVHIAWLYLDRISPNKITKCPFQWNFLESINFIDLLHLH